MKINVAAYTVTYLPNYTKLFSKYVTQVNPKTRISFSNNGFHKTFQLGGHIEALFGSHYILISDTSPIKWRQLPDIAIAVDRFVKH